MMLYSQDSYTYTGQFIDGERNFLTLRSAQVDSNVGGYKWCDVQACASVLCNTKTSNYGKN